MTYKPFRIVATIDWIEIQIALKRCTNFQTIRRHFPAKAVPYIAPRSDEANGTASAFSFRIQDPGTPDLVQALLDGLEAQFPFSEPPRINGVEVALDAYLRDQSQGDALLEDLAMQLFTRHASLVADWRVTGREGTTGEVKRPVTVLELRSLMVGAGLTVVAGERGADITQRFYMKRTDGVCQTSETALALPRERHRARCEITLKNDACPFKTMEEWRSFKFEALARTYFAFRRIKPVSRSATLVERVRHNMRSKFVRSAPDAGNPRDEQRFSERLRRSRRRTDLATVRDTDLNERAYDALRELTKRTSNLRRVSDDLRTSIFSGAQEAVCR